MNTPTSGKSEPVSVRVLDREYTVGVSDTERDSLASAARMLDARMRELRGTNKMVAPDRLAVLTALNLAHELQQKGLPIPDGVLTRKELVDVLTKLYTEKK